MANWRRLPGVFYANRYRAITLVSFISAVFYGISQLGIVCSNHEVEAVLEQLVSVLEFISLNFSFF